MCYHKKEEHGTYIHGVSILEQWTGSLWSDIFTKHEYNFKSY